MPNKDLYTALFVLPSEEQIIDFLKSVDLAKEVILQDDGRQWLKSKITTYEKYLSDDHEHTFDFVVFVFPDLLTYEDFELKKDMYIFYSNVPVCQILLTKKFVGDEESRLEVFKIQSFFQSNFKTNLENFQPYDPQNGKQLKNHFKDYAKAYDKKFENDLKIAFNKFDKDGSGSIDKEELADLSKELGSELTEEQLQNALKDLDLNGDGVIDIDEFARWYFSGMKPYSGLKRSLLQIGKQSVSILEALKSEEVSKAIHENLKVTTHKVSFALNDPKEVHFVDASFHIIGPQYAKLLAESEVYRSKHAQLLLIDKHIDDGEVSMVYGKFSVSLEPGNLEKNQKLFAPIEAFLRKKCGAGFIQKYYPEFELTDTKLTITILIKVHERYLPDLIPDQLVAALIDVEQYVNLHVSLGFDAEQILSEGETSMIEHYLKGFKYQLSISHLKHLKKALMKFFGDKQNKIQEIFQLWGPAMMFGSDISIKLNYDDIEELKQHPYASLFLVDFHSIISRQTGKEKEYFQNWKEHMDTSFISDEILKEIEGTQQESRVEQILVWENVVHLIDGFTQNTAVEANFLIENLGVFELKVQGKGFGKWLSHIFKIATFEKVKQDFERLKRDFEK